MSRWLPPWRIRPAAVDEPDPIDWNKVPLAGFCDHGVGMLDDCPACTEAHAMRDQLELVRKQRDNALARADTVLIESRALTTDLAGARKRVAALEALVEEMRTRTSSDEAAAWKRQAEQDRANCLAMQAQLEEAHRARQLVELEHLWVTNPAFVDKVGAEKVRGAK